MRGIKNHEALSCGECGRAFDAPASKQRRFCSIICLNQFRSKIVTARHFANCTPTERPTFKDIAWAAGIFEGEGYVQRTGEGAGYLRITIAQKDQWLIDRLRAMFGGRARFIRKYENSPTSRAYHRWECNGARAMGFMLTIFSFLSPRRQKQFLTAYYPLMSA